MRNSEKIEVTMFKMLKKIIKYPRLTQDYPNKPLKSGMFIGKPEIDQTKCTLCEECISRCPSEAIIMDSSDHTIDINYGSCIFCTLCEEVCPEGAIAMTDKIELAEKEIRSSDQSNELIESQLQAKIKKVLGRSLAIREVDSGSCNGCDYEINALNNSINDIERLGIHFVASPRHADMLLVTGCAVRNMESALIKTYEAVPDPKLVVAVGACACSGGIFKDSYATSNGIGTVIPVDVCIPGCPPQPQAILYGILKAIDRIR
ncbi:MAG: NADH-quinone oxidoreductase subunit NuoB [Eubacteriales bacterium]|nr:NADH-quinone oxidoreductase subunit NuoB [Eubacteriales bacterium]MDD3198723.1 NADH-quinone oxidoreductase subunit NuoB [Eubacteriales bacterium]MDD4629031.1 NADH-quinone oxidoreductase subunit NuoB [Eubacteriales bacterium]